MSPITIRAIGRLPEAWQRDACDTYLERLAAFGKIDVIELPEGHGGSAKPDLAKTKSREAEALLKGISSEAWVVALDEGGKEYSSPTFAKTLAGWSENGRPLVFLIGGSWGLDQSVKDRTKATLSLSAMTMPHGLARVVLLEQLYRAAMIERGKTYHK